MAKQEYKEAKSPEKKGSRRRVRMEIEPAKNGYTVTHHFQSSGMEYHKPLPHVFGSAKEMVQHVANAHGVKFGAESKAAPEGEQEAEGE